MSKTTERVDIYRCDKPGCDVRHIVERNGDKADGLYGTVVLAVDGWVTSSLGWYACRIEHIADAIQHVLDEAEEANRHGSPL